MYVLCGGGGGGDVDVYVSNKFNFQYI